MIRQTAVVVSRALDSDDFDTVESFFYQALEDSETDEFEKLGILNIIQFAGKKV
jgi:hypothetical protein